MYEIIFYKDRKGNSEVEEYILTLQSKTDKSSRINLEKITSCVDLLSEQGINIGAPYIKYLKDDIWELRPIRNRILFAYFEDNKFILLNIFMKKTQKTSKKEIEKAKRYLEDYTRRNKENG